MDRGAWWSRSPWDYKESDMTEQLTLSTSLNPVFWPQLIYQKDILQQYFQILSSVSSFFVLSAGAPPVTSQNQPLGHSQEDNKCNLNCYGCFGCLIPQFPGFSSPHAQSLVRLAVDLGSFHTSEPREVPQDISPLEPHDGESCLTLYNPMDCSPLGSSVHDIFQARILPQNPNMYKWRHSDLRQRGYKLSTVGPIS